MCSLALCIYIAIANGINDLYIYIDMFMYPCSVFGLKSFPRFSHSVFVCCDRRIMSTTIDEVNELMAEAKSLMQGKEDGAIVALCEKSAQASCGHRSRRLNCGDQADDCRSPFR